MFGKVCFQLRDAIWVFQPGQFFQPGGEIIFRDLINSERLIHRRPVNPDAPIIDFLIQMVLINCRLIQK